jgi:UDP-3-O-[3-hydroxymyristoyl] glucosamine N-acyltransferase
MNLRDLAEQLQCPLEGDGDIDIRRVAGIEHAQPGDITFVDSPRYVAFLATTRASAVIVTPAQRLAPPGPLAPGPALGVLRSDHPYVTFARAVALFAPTETPMAGIHPLSAVADSAAIGPGVSIGPFVTVGAGASIGARTAIHPHVAVGAGVRIGDDCILYPHVSIRDRVTIGHRVIVHDGVVIGGDGFGFAKQPDGTHLKIPQTADVVIEDDVEIGANSTIDRPAVGETRIRAGTKIDNLVHIAHGVSVGRRVIFAAQVGVSGSTVIEDDVILAGQVGVAGHLRVGKGVMATAQSGIPSSLDAGQYVSGSPAIPHQDWLKSAAAYRQLPVLRKRVAELEHRIAELEEKLEECRIRLNAPDPSAPRNPGGPRR